MNRDKLLSQGFLEFNLKNFDVDLYNNLRKSIPYNSQESILRSLLTKYYLCKDLNILTSEFIDEFRLNYSNFSNTLLPRHQIEHALELASQPIGSRRFLEMGFFGKNYIELNNVKKYIEENYEGVKSQSWFQGQIDGNTSTIFEPLYDAYESIIKNFYDIPEHYYTNLKKHGMGITCFEKNDFIIKHRDGQNEGRYAGMLIYLNDDWDSNDGGQIVLDNKSVVNPEFGNIVLFDYTKNNIIHEVIEPSVGKSRFASLTFVEI